jgi:hypothetical protein
MKACVTEGRISVPCTKQHGTRLPRPSPPSHLRVAAAPRRFYSPLLILFSPSKVESARPLRFHLHTTPFPRIQYPIARSRLAGHWRVIPHLLVLRRIISSSTLDILLTRPCIEPLLDCAHIPFFQPLPGCSCLPSPLLQAHLFSIPVPRKLPGTISCMRQCLSQADRAAKTRKQLINQPINIYLCIPFR